MDFAWDQDATALKRAAEEFGASLNAGLADRDLTATFDDELWRSCAAFGALGLPIPERFGGSDQSLRAVVYALEGLGYGCRDNGLLFGLMAQLWSVQMPVLLFGTDDQKEHYLGPLVAGTLVGAHAVTETDAGSDVFAMQTRARAEGEEYVLDGSKCFVTSAPVAGLFLVVARTEEGEGPAGLTAFLVDRDTEGLQVTAAYDKMGLRTSTMGEVALSGCRVSRDQVLGTVGSGATVFGAAMEWERAFILAPALGTMRRQLEQCLQYARTRRQFGAAIGKREAVAEKLVQMQMRLETSQLITYRAAWKKDQGHRLTYEPSQLKLLISEGWVQTSLDAIQIHGAAGYMREVGVERDLRDALASRIYSGTSEIQRSILAKFLGL